MKYYRKAWESWDKLTELGVLDVWMHSLLKMKLSEVASCAFSRNSPIVLEIGRCNLLLHFSWLSGSHDRRLTSSPFWIIYLNTTLMKTQSAVTRACVQLIFSPGFSTPAFTRRDFSFVPYTIWISQGFNAKWLTFCHFYRYWNPYPNSFKI